MCGQFAVLADLKAIRGYYNFLKEGDFLIDDHDFFGSDTFTNVFLPDINVIPMTSVPIVTNIGEKVLLRKARWGLVPFWAKDESIAEKAINARFETLTEKPSFKYAFKERRCLIPFSGFYERDFEHKIHYFPNENEKLQSFAGLYEIWGKDSLLTFTIITCPSDDKVTEVNPRMPVVLGENAAINWLKVGELEIRN